MLEFIYILKISKRLMPPLRSLQIDDECKIDREREECVLPNFLKLAANILTIF